MNQPPKKKFKFFRNLVYTVLVFVLIISIAIIIWFKKDPEAPIKLTNIAFGVVFVIIFIYVIIRKLKKERKRSSVDENYDADGNNSQNEKDD